MFWDVLWWSINGTICYGTVEFTSRMTDVSGHFIDVTQSLLVWGGEIFGLKLTSESDSQPFGQILTLYKFCALLNYCLHCTFWDWSMTFLLPHNPCCSLPFQASFVSINESPRPINKFPNDICSASRTSSACVSTIDSWLTKSSCWERSLVLALKRANWWQVHT